ncbi:MAG: TRAM domain-containing protein, partial [Solirubrobacterales bacterium]
MAQGGRGVARTEGGFVVFVAGGLPGDRVRARVGKSKKSWAEAAIVELVEPGPERIGDRCIHGGEPCPGAAWQGLPYERQLAEKEKQVAEALERLGSFAGIALEPIVPAVAEWRYRNKLEYSFGNPSSDDPPGDPVLGFHARGQWDRIVDVDDCLLASVANNEARNSVRAWARAEGLNAVDAAGAGELRNLIVREGRRTGQIQTRLVTAAEQIPRPPVDLHTVIAGPSGATSGPTGVLGEEFLRERLGDLELRVSPGAFLQTNTETAERLYSVAREFAGLKGEERLFDLYCGIGTIGLGMAADAGEVWGIENVAEAIVDAEANAELNGISNARFRVADARLGIR